jgi:hypothetical protein
VNKPGFEPWTKTVVVAAGESITVHASLTRPEAAAAAPGAPASGGDSAPRSGIRVSGWQPKP